MLKYIEWLDFEEKELDIINETNIRTVFIKIDENFNIGVRFICTIPSEVSIPNRPEVFFKAIFNGKIELVACDKLNSLERYKLNGISINAGKIGVSEILEYSGFVVSLEKYYDEKVVGKTVFNIYWLLNASESLAYPDIMHVSGKEKYEYIWGDFATDTYEFSSPESLSRSIIRLKYKQYDFIFGRVNKDAYKKGSFIRFFNNTDILEQDVYEIVQILIYVLGVEFKLIGKTSFNKASSPTNQIFISTFENGIDKIFTKLENPPIPIRYQDLYTGIMPQLIINEFFEKYLANKEKYQLDKIIWYLSYSRDQHFYIKMQPLSTAFDIICNCYFKGKKNTTIEKEIFDKITESFNAIVDDNIRNQETCKELKNRIKNLNSNSMNQRNILIFKELSMQLSKLEMESLLARNVSVHGSLKDNDNLKIIRESNAYTVLMNRVVLKLIDISIYIDYSDQNQIAHNVIEPQVGEYNLLKIE